MPKRIEKLIFSMLTAIICGGIFAILGIYGFDYYKNNNLNKNNQDLKLSNSTALLEEGDIDPTFISKLSRVSIYSADNNREIIESAKNSLPRTVSPTGVIRITSPAYIVKDLKKDSIILEKNSKKTYPIASITKLITAVLAKKFFNENKYITVTTKALSTYGNEARLREGEKFRVKELLYPLLMVSSNDASEVLAGAYEGGRKSFIREMNDWVNSIGAYHTYFVDPSGISPLNISNANDLSIITQWIIKNEPDIFDITLEKSKTIRTHTWINPAHLLNLASYAGGKNGYTPEANRTSVALFKLGKQERLYSLVLLNSSSRDNDILNLLDEAIR